MTVNRGLWVPIVSPSIGTTEVEARLADAALFESNNGADPRSGLLNPQTATIVTGTANMSYNVAACNPVIHRAAGEGVYRFSATGTTNIATTAAPTANSRIDVIWVKQNDPAKGDANNQAVVGVTNGAVAASPVAPAIPAGALELARATVGTNITATTSASITQTFRYTALRGAPIPVRNTTERAEITAPRLGMTVERLDTSTREQYNGTRWAKPGLTEIGRTSAGIGGTLAASPSWSDLMIVTATTSGGGVIIDYDLTLVNGNSGNHRAAAVRVLWGSTELDSWAFTAPWISGVQVPIFPSLQVSHTPAAGTYTWKVQGQAGSGDAGSVVMHKGSMSVTEKP